MWVLGLFLMQPGKGIFRSGYRWLDLLEDLFLCGTENGFGVGGDFQRRVLSGLY